MAMADIAHQAVDSESEESIPLSQIAERQKISLPYLEQLFLRLRRAGLVESARGRSGGYKLTRPAATITVAEIMAAVDEGVRMTRCEGDASAPCVGGERCLTHGLWSALGETIHQFLDGVTLAEVVEGGPRVAPRVAPPPVLFSGGLP
jgi:Rrf2 family protein